MGKAAPLGLPNQPLWAAQKTTHPAPHPPDTHKLPKLPKKVDSLHDVARCAVGCGLVWEVVLEERFNRKQSTTRESRPSEVFETISRVAL